MNIKGVKALAQILNNMELSAIEVVEGETKIRIEKNISFPSQSYNANQPAAVQPVINSEKIPALSNGVVDFNNIIEIESPMVGVFYEAAAPGAEPFVKVGSKIKKGDVLCIIEAMKLMNEIVAEMDGEILDICVKNGQIVEYSQCLFKVI